MFFILFSLLQISKKKVIKNHIVRLKENLKIFITDFLLLKPTLNFFTVLQTFSRHVKTIPFNYNLSRTIKKKMFKKNTFYNETPEYILNPRVF